MYNLLFIANIYNNGDDDNNSNSNNNNYYITFIVQTIF